ncbi:hypothetical protein PVT68_04290 [Microbulbifer bruguierae]|uniref:DUF885 domain-containing protein n=1 Tax=Microbulbifer bruguierae TaxID=3029061 RepID=A0ABY8NF06_9GAMM|nr:hypothetical protein [Microbulbifer bruguierae]WGL17513.1 hypothetical protein PVT68_04290 [Microbulbifer bruguierae]
MKRIMIAGGCLLFSLLGGCGAGQDEGRNAGKLGGGAGENPPGPTGPDTVAPEDPHSDSALNPLAEDYVRLVLTLGKHDKAYVDAYYGPAGWKAEAEADQATPAELASRAEMLLAKLPETIEPADDLQTLRAHYLKTQLRAVVAHAHHIADASYRNFQREAKALYDTEPPLQQYAEFEPVLAALEKELPGSEPLHIRVQQFQEQYRIPESKLSAVFDAAIKECKARTAAHIQLPANESFELEYVQGKPWSGYNWYQGKSHSLIQINSELPVYIDRAVDLGCHEGYPGHHTYNALLEQKLVADRGWVEYSVYPLFSPQSLIAEGSANYGIDLAFPGDEKTRFEKNVLYPLAGLNPAGAEKYQRVLSLLAKLKFAENIVARQYIDGEIEEREAVNRFQKYTAMSPEKAAQRVKFVDAYGAYVINYNWGKQLVQQYVEEGSDSPEARWDKFSRLLSSPRLPSSLTW